MNSSGAFRRTLTNIMHHLPAGSVAKQRTNPNRWIELTVGVRRLKDLPDLSALDSKRPAERRYMTRDQLKNDYGSDPAAVEAIEKFAADHYLVVTKDERASPSCAAPPAGQIAIDRTAAERGCAIPPLVHPDGARRDL